jgi:hypothetical protein
MATDPFATLRAAGRRNRIQGLVVAALSSGLGAFMVALHALRLDPEAARMSAPMVVALYAFAGLFVLVGVLMGYVALFRAGAEVKEIERRLSHAPDTIAGAKRMVATRRGIRDGESEGDFGQHQVVIEGTDGRTFTINASARQVTEVLALVRARCPGATVRG